MRPQNVQSMTFLLPFAEVLSARMDRHYPLSPTFNSVPNAASWTSSAHLRLTRARSSHPAGSPVLGSHTPHPDHTPALSGASPTPLSCIPHTRCFHSPALSTSSTQPSPLYLLNTALHFSPGPCRPTSISPWTM